MIVYHPDPAAHKFGTVETFFYKINGREVAFRFENGKCEPATQGLADFLLDKGFLPSFELSDGTLAQKAAMEQLMDRAIEKGLVRKEKKTFTFGDVKLGDSRTSALETLGTDTELRERLEAELAKVDPQKDGGDDSSKFVKDEE